MIGSQFAIPFSVGAVIALAVVGGAIFVPFASWNQHPFFLCQNINALITSYHSSGFLMSEPTGYGMQFVIKPNSTAFLQLVYHTVDTVAQYVYANSSYYIRPIEHWSRLGGNTWPWLNASEVGMMAFPLNIVLIRNDTLASTYEVTASATAQQGAYLGAFWNTCGPQVVLTIGYSFYNGPDLGGWYL